MNKRRNPNYKLKVKLLQEVNLKCPFCQYFDASKLEHHHIDGDRSNTVFENLISVCPNCHTEIESGEIRLEEVKKVKKSFSKSSNYFYKGIYTFDNFRIHDNRVGILKKGMTVKDIYTVLPDNQIRKTIQHGEHCGEDMYDAYEIYDSDRELILTIETSEQGNIDDKIELIVIHSKKFHTLTNVRIGASISEIMENELIENYEPSINQIHFEIKWINAVCSINKTELNNKWWNESKKKIEINGDNLSAKIDSIAIRW